MDIHKPHPWHGWREFLKEYAIIVLGVLTALGAEAVVQRLHEARLSAEARDTVRAEINLDLANMKRRLQTQPCVDRRIAELQAWISDAESGRPTTTPLTIGGPVHPVAYTERWEAATAAGRTSLLSAQEQRDFARVYMQIKNFDAEQAEERLVWGELMGLEGAQHPSAELLAHARATLGRARMLNIVLLGAIKNGAAFAKRVGIEGVDSQLLVTPGAGISGGLICLPLSTPPAEAAALVRANLGAR